MPNPAVPSSRQITDATDSLAQLMQYLRTEPPVGDMLPLLAPLLDRDTGIPILLGDILRSAARSVADQDVPPGCEETAAIISGLQEAAQEATDSHVLHWDVQRLASLLAPATEPVPSREAVEQATRTLADLARHLRNQPSFTDATALLEPLLDSEHGAPMQLGDVLMALYRLAADMEPSTRRTSTLNGLREFALHLFDMHRLQYDLADLQKLHHLAPRRTPPAATESGCR